MVQKFCVSLNANYDSGMQSCAAAYQVGPDLAATQVQAYCKHKQYNYAMRAAGFPWTESGQDVAATNAFRTCWASNTTLGV